MPISALPSKYGIGSFGKDAYRFVDFLCETNTKCWQVLPLNPTSYGDSPYQSPASCAGNPYFIDLDILFQKGLLTKEEIKAQEHNTRRVDYGWLFSERYTALRNACTVFLTRGGLKTPIPRLQSGMTSIKQRRGQENIETNLRANAAFGNGYSLNFSHSGRVFYPTHTVRAYS